MVELERPLRQKFRQDNSSRISSFQVGMENLRGRLKSYTLEKTLQERKSEPLLGKQRNEKEGNASTASG